MSQAFSILKREKTLFDSVFIFSFLCSWLGLCQPIPGLIEVPTQTANNQNEKFKSILAGIFLHNACFVSFDVTQTANNQNEKF